MDTATAATYCNVSVSAIHKARNEGHLGPKTRRGERGACTFKKTALDAWMTTAESGA
jgi:hypothetical protein